MKMIEKLKDFYWRLRGYETERGSEYLPIFDRRGKVVVYREAKTIRRWTI